MFNINSEPGLKEMITDKSSLGPSAISLGWGDIRTAEIVNPKATCVELLKSIALL